MSNQTVERRRYERLTLELPASLLLNHPSGITEIKGRVMNISKGGCVFSGETSIPPASSCILKLGAILTPSVSHEYECRMIWLSERESRCGLEFVYLPASMAQEWVKIFELAGRIKRKRFSLELTVYLKDTNAEGNVYFARYFEWQGMAREAFFRKVFSEAIEAFSTGELRLITVDASVHFKSQLFLFDEVEIRVKPIRPKHASQASIDLEFLYVKKQSGEEVATGKETLAFADSKGNLISIPKQMLEAGRPYLDDLEQIRWLHYLEQSLKAPNSL